MNVILINLNVNGEANVGGLIGKATNNSTIDNCNVSGYINGFNFVGGLCGKIDGKENVDRNLEFRLLNRDRGCHDGICLRYGFQT